VPTEIDVDEEEAGLSQRRFTLEQANALIPQLEIIMGKLLQHRATLAKAITEMASNLGVEPESLTVPQILELRPALHELMEEGQQLIEHIERLGVEVKGLDLGLVDFPSDLNGELVLLCWQFGEQEITHYHTLDGGFAGRRSLDLVYTKPRYLN